MEIIRTGRLELVPLSAPFVEAVIAGDRAAAAHEIGAEVSSWLVAESAHIVHLWLAQTVTGGGEQGPLGRAIVVGEPAGPRRVVGSIGFLGPPDARGRLEIALSIEPGFQDCCYSLEAMSALVTWASDRYRIQRFLIAVTVAGLAGCSRLTASAASTHATLAAPLLLR